MFLSEKPEQACDSYPVAVHQEIRRHVASLNGSKLSFIEKHASDVAPTAPSFLSGLTDAELAAVKAKADSHLDPKIIEARQQTQRSLTEVEAGWAKAIKLIAEKGGLTKDAQDAWSAQKVAA